ncbi:gamma-glutamylcyclotransferase family protein [Cognatishimia sp. 1_MG-2023]|uniref:gamma-glutamylcyclotransferase family protein n=1 Tax=Cognatishimia sp. 1_MG-2023 TaxID=3062642 RepID=UPI0026E30F8C|nr:gamma-glutamylcyclotransferase family protein [Cognatishimia sp. 1_MG-2023]MDO6726210.1 gamma-glutamylcyclotransferase family protein [Cognatishimia sp. 1_MG-2023]
MSTPYFFGYGSLVNRNTHNYPDARPARLMGWRRVWRQTTFAPRPILTAEPYAGSEIDGLIAHVPNNDWQALDAREHAYDRVLVTEAAQHSAAAESVLATYTVPMDKYPPAPTPRPIYLSYLDVVIQGYLQEFGETGALDFFATTSGWDAPIRDDRADPIYPRHQCLSMQERVFVDDQIKQLGCRILP